MTTPEDPRNRIRLATLVSIVAVATCGPRAIEAQSLTIDIDVTSPETWRAPRDFESRLDLLDGISVLAHRTGVESGWQDRIWLRPGQVPTNAGDDIAWTGTWAGGHHASLGYSVHAYLTEDGHVALGFHGLEGADIASFEIDFGNHCLDRTEPSPGTPGSGPGMDVHIDDGSEPSRAQSGDLDLRVTYQRPVVTDAGFQGDTYASLLIEMTGDSFQATDRFGLVTDLDPRFDDPGARHDTAATFDWNGLAATPLYGSRPGVSEDALELCRNDAVSFVSPDEACYLEATMHEDWDCDLGLDPSWSMQVAGPSGIPSGPTLGFSAAEAICSGFLTLRGDGTFARFRAGAEWFLAVRSSDGTHTEIPLADDWYWQGEKIHVADGGVTGAGIGLRDDGDALTVMNATLGRFGMIEHASQDGESTWVNDATEIEVRVRGVGMEEARAATDEVEAFVLASGSDCIGIASVEVTGCSTDAVPEDLDGDGRVNGIDLAQILVSWGECPGCPADFDGDGTVDGLDFSRLLVAWTG